MDSNHRLPAPKAGALTGLRYAPMKIGILGTCILVNINLNVNSKVYEKLLWLLFSVFYLCISVANFASRCAYCVVRYATSSHACGVVRYAEKQSCVRRLALCEKSVPLSLLFTWFPAFAGMTTFTFSFILSARQRPPSVD